MGGIALTVGDCEKDLMCHGDAITTMVGRPFFPRARKGNRQETDLEIFGRGFGAFCRQDLWSLAATSQQTAIVIDVPFFAFGESCFHTENAHKVFIFNQRVVRTSK